MLKKTYYVLDDFNINIQKFKRTSVAHNYINLIVSYGARSIINKSARVIPESFSMKDHIITNDSIHRFNFFIFKVGVTDPYPFYVK